MVAAPRKLTVPAPAVYVVLQLVAILLVWRLVQTGNCGGGHRPWISSIRSFPDKSSVQLAHGAKHAAHRFTPTPTPGLHIEEHCKSQHADELARRFGEHSAGSRNFTACPDKGWLHKLRDVSPGGSKVFVDIGGGQGFTSAALFSLWAPQLGITPASLQEQMPGPPCGACNECAEEAPLTAASGVTAQVQVLTVEPSPLGYSHLVKLRNQALNNTAAGVQWRLMQVAVGSRGGAASVAVCSGALGGCRLTDPAEAGAEAEADIVAVVTVDELLAIHKLPDVDLLKASDELAALGGALGSLAAGRVGVLVFGYSAKGAWRQPGRLGDAVARLDELGYACFLQGKQTPDGSLARLTGCWQPSYEAHAPGSVLCVPRTHELYPHVERMSLRYALYRDVYYRHLEGVGAAAAAEPGTAAAAAGEAQQEQPAAVAQPAAAAAAAAAQAQPAAARNPVGPGLPVTNDLKQWAEAPKKFIFQDPGSLCRLHPDGTAAPAAERREEGRQPFLFDTASMPTNATSCAHCPKDAAVPMQCCGVCVFERRMCRELYPGQHKSEANARLLMASGYQLQDFTPCELFQRIRGRTLWFMGDSQTWHFYYSAECFLRGFAATLKRSGPLPWEHGQKLVTVTRPHPVVPICLELALGTRVCAVRVDSAEAFRVEVLPQLHRHTPDFNRDLVVFNVGLHYGTPGINGEPPQSSKLYKDLAALVPFKERNSAALPKLIWTDVSIQHFSGPDGSYPGPGQRMFTCSPLHAWYSGDPVVRGGGRRNRPLAPLIPRFADAHMRTWNASVPFWDTHKPGECTHWCSPSAYHALLYLLNDVLRDSRLGNPAGAPPRRSVHATPGIQLAAAAAARWGASNQTAGPTP